MPKIITKLVAAIGFGLAAMIVAQVAFNMAGDATDSGLSPFGLVFAILGGLVGWYRVK
jgi:hypothetical protein